MSAEITYHCDFCRKKVVSCSVNLEHQAFCLDEAAKKMTNDLSRNIHGPHICGLCVQMMLEPKKQ